MNGLLFVLLLTGSIFSSQDVSIQSNVGDSNEYHYVITEINGNEVYGEAINNIRNDNKSIFLYEHELDFNVTVGDKISIIWGNEEDQFLSIEELQPRNNTKYNMFDGLLLYDV